MAESDSSHHGEARPLRPAMSQVVRGSEESMSPRTGPAKATEADLYEVVSIAEPESPDIQPLEGYQKKQFPAGLGRRLSGRRTPTSNQPPSRMSLASQTSFEDLPAAMLAANLLQDDMKQHKHSHHHLNHPHDKHHGKLLVQVTQWLQAEKAKRAARKSKKQAEVKDENGFAGAFQRPRSSSQSSNSSMVSLEKLQRILEENMASFGFDHLPVTSPKLEPRKHSFTSLRKLPAKLHRAASSDTEYHDGDIIVPSCDVVLDNSKTLSYSGGAAASDLDLPAKGKRAERERRAWTTFKLEILRLAHTLRLKGWRRIPLDEPDSIEVERLSGALTNAVYVVSPPRDIPSKSSESGHEHRPKRPPTKLLLRIYGPQVEHLIDRETELGILRRLARKKIGPRLLGTFTNGRFEEFFPSKTLTAADIRDPETSKQIAKRMRELHDGVELLDEELNNGPFVWHNWDKWVDRCEYVIKYLDHQILEYESRPGRSRPGSFKERGLICGVEWPIFRKTVENYRKWILEQYGGFRNLRERLVFAHNDTQYGNILRLSPTGESPLLLPANTHKQLVVIDFEYASANTIGLEFANHFTEWCYNYHNPISPHSLDEAKFPTPEEQRRFVRSYVNHRPQFNSRASATPKAVPSAGPGSISAFMLDARTPSSTDMSTYNYDEEEEQRIKAAEKQVDALLHEAVLWRVANSAQWVAWGIVQAKVPGLDDDEAPDTLIGADSASTCGKPKSPVREGRPDGRVAEALMEGDSVETGRLEEAGDGEEEEEFDYLAYAQERAMFFWGDCVELGLVKREELPQELVGKLKIVKH